MLRRTSTVSLMAVTLLVAPLGGVLLLLYGAGRLAVRRRRAVPVDPYDEWLRDLGRSRETDPRSPSRI